ncbi:uncharacterized protein [Typha angustifolia]|uniref:uncharacterized protein n=1 Tax=Typha angustifolia TaxID=59011 RepID=UPI003C2E33E2
MSRDLVGWRKVVVELEVGFEHGGLETKPPPRHGGAGAAVSGTYEEAKDDDDALIWEIVYGIWSSTTSWPSLGCLPYSPTTSSSPSAARGVWRVQPLPRSPPRLHRPRARVLPVLTDTWYSSGSLSPNGTLVQTPGVQRRRPGRPVPLHVRRSLGTRPTIYYPNGNIIVVGGRGQFSYEFLPKNPNCNSEFELRRIGAVKIVKASSINLGSKMSSKKFLRYATRWRFPKPSELGLIGLTPASIEEKAIKCETGGHDMRRVDLGFLTTRRQRTARSCRRRRHAAMREVGHYGHFVPVGYGRDAGLIINGAARGAAGWGMGREPVLHPVIYNIKKNEFDVINPLDTSKEEEEEEVVTMVAPAFATHSFSMSQRVLVLDAEGVRRNAARICRVLDGSGWIHVE